MRISVECVGPQQHTGSDCTLCGSQDRAFINIPQSTKRVFTLCQNDSIEDTLFFLICCAASCHCEGPWEEAIQKILGAVLGCIILWTGQSYARVPNLGSLV